MAKILQWGVCGWGRGGGEWKCMAGQLAVITFEEGSERGGGGGLSLISRPCLPISPLLSALLPFLFFNVSFAYFWLAVRLFLDKKLDR
jgi:hypothetical protein